MATRDELKDPHFIPYSGALRFKVTKGSRQSGGEMQLQQYDVNDGWSDVPILDADEIPVGGATPNARNA